MGKQQKTQNKGKSYLETECRLKSNELLSIDEIIKIKQKTSEALWTKNEISTTFYDELSEQKEHESHRRSDFESYQHSLLKSPDWLSCQVLHNLKPINLGGNPFKKRRKKSPFPLIAKPRFILNNNNSAHHQLQHVQQPLLEKESESKLEQEVIVSLPINNDNDQKQNEAVIKNEVKEIKDEKKEIKEATPPKSEIIISKEAIAPKVEVVENTHSVSPKVQIAPKPVAPPKKPVFAKKLIIKPAPPKPDKKRVNAAIERAKRKQNKKKAQIIGVKRRTPSSSSSGSNSMRNSKSLSPSNIKEPVLKKVKLLNGTNGDKQRNNVHIKKQIKSKIVNTEDRNNHNFVQYNHAMNGNGHFYKKESTERHTANILAFVTKYRQMIRSQHKFDNDWFQNQLHSLNGLPLETKHNFYKLLINEAKAYNRWKLAQNIQQML